MAHQAARPTLRPPSFLAGGAAPHAGGERVGEGELDAVLSRQASGADVLGRAGVLAELGEPGHVRVLAAGGIGVPRRAVEELEEGVEGDDVGRVSAVGTQRRRVDHVQQGR
jgi:hypothetical protein